MYTKIMVSLCNDWDDVLGPLFKSDLYLRIREFLKKEYFSTTVYPPMEDLFNCFRLTPFSKVKVVILGQDPYPNKGQAHGLCFSVKEGVKAPPSLQNIFKELSNEYGVPVERSGDLTDWAKQGVLLLNTVLTVREGQPNSHKDCGWTTFTDEVIKKLNTHYSPIVFLLWGANARSKKKFIDTSKHLVLESVHPSPLSAYNGFFGCDHFYSANKFLMECDMEPIKWF